MKVLSLFDGISCGRLALDRAGIQVEKYYSSEIKKIAIKVSENHYSDIIRLGDVTKIHYDNGTLYYEDGKIDNFEIDLLIGGSPCQDFSIAGTWSHDIEAYGLKGNKSVLFYEYLRLLNEIKPRFFLLENVKMKEASERELNDLLGVKGIHINSNLVSIQNRPRIYWTNIPGVSIPEDMGINFQDYIDKDPEYCRQFKVNRTKSREKMWGDGLGGPYTCKNVTYADKVNCLMRKQDRFPNSGLIEFEDFCRYLTIREMEIAQTLPVGYCDGLSYNQVCDVTGDGWTVDVIAHLFKGLKEVNL